MKDFATLRFDPNQCRAELLAFKNLLDGKKELEETADIKPFFEAHLQLAAFVGSYAASITRFEAPRRFSIFRRSTNMSCEAATRCGFSTAS